MNAVELIAAKRDGAELTGDELRQLVLDFTHGELADYGRSGPGRPRDVRAA
jgi:thymidine phosphorylase